MNQSEQEAILNMGADPRFSYETDESDILSDNSDFLSTDPLNPTSDRRKNTALLSWQYSLLHRRSSRAKCYIVSFLVCAIVFVVIAVARAFIRGHGGGHVDYTHSPPWYPSPKGGSAKSWAASYEKAAQMVSRMTLAEKVNVTTGTGWEMGLAVGSTGPALNVGFPQLNFQDGPIGIRYTDHATAFPAGITVGATWNKELMYLLGKVHAEEVRGKGINGVLAPCVGPLGRMPAGGRNWEAFGSDPYLQGVAGAQGIRGIQSQGIMATIKHFIGNEQEHFRQPWEWGLPDAMSSNINDRTLHELYAWPFADAVKAGVVSVMCSYNMVNNSYACENSKLLNGILKDELGFQGFVMSDWLAQRSGVASSLSGLDMTLPGDGLRWKDGQSLWGSELTRSILNGSVPMDRLDDMVTRVVAAWYQMGQDAPDFFDSDGPNFSSWTDETMGFPFPGSPSPQTPIEVNKFVDVQSDHAAVARRLAAEGIVLLKNKDECLPLGVNGVASSRKKAVRGEDSKIKIGIFGEDAGPGKGPNFCPERACNQGTLGSGWGSGAVEFPYLVPPVEALAARFDEKSVELSQHLTNKPSFKLYADLDVCIVFANSDAGEGFSSWEGIRGDRNNLNLQKGGDDLIASIARGCGGGEGEVIVVIHAVGPVLVDKWINFPTVKAVLHAHLPGQESGNALADVIFGDVNPSGKLPYTIGRNADQYGPDSKIMFSPNGDVPQQDFNEGLYIDYRYFDKNKLKPRFEFGYGLSYTKFELFNMTVQQVRPKSALPAARPVPAALPPDYNSTIPDKSEALFPAGIRQLKKYIYPYLESVDGIEPGQYPYPDGYDTVRPPSEAGGDEGGNPDLWETYVKVSVDVHNTGLRSGQAVVQMYMGYPKKASDASEIDFPVKVLRGFEKVYLEESASTTVTFNLTRRDLSYWDVKRQNWVMVTDKKYKFAVGQSSQDLSYMMNW